MKNLLFVLIATLVLSGCETDFTNYYADGEDKGIAIFSDEFNNISSCFIAGKPWRTVSRKSSGFPGVHTSYEVDIFRQKSIVAKDTLIIRWYGYFEKRGNLYGQSYLDLHLALPANSTFKDLSALQGKRINIDSTNGFFMLTDPDINPTNIKGTGSIYFHTSRFDSVATNGYNGNISGLFEVDFTSFKITKGRFDHFITEEQMRNF